MRRASPRTLALCAAATAAVLVAVLGLARGPAGEAARRPSPALRAVPPTLAPSKTDAISLTANFLSAMNLRTLLSARRRHSVLAVYADRAARPSLERLYNREHARVAASYSRAPRVARAALLGYRVDGLTAQTATISVWAASIGGSADYPPTSGWWTTTVDLAWTDHGWRVLLTTGRSAHSRAKLEPSAPSAMCRELARLSAVCVVVLGFAPVSAAQGQTLVPTDLLGGHTHKKPPRPSKPCGHGVTLICAGTRSRKARRAS